MPTDRTASAAGVRPQLEAFLAFCRLEKGLSANSISAYSADLERFNKFIGKSGTPGPEDLRSYLDSLYQAGLGSRSIARHLATLRNFFGYLLREGQIQVDPTERLRPPRQWQNIPKF